MLETGTPRYDFIDAIRGFAASAVMYSHGAEMLASMACCTGQPSAGLPTQVEPGKFGVAIFFMVSGFVIPFSLRGERVEGLKRFAISRVMRLYPLYWLSILLAATISGLMYGHAYRASVLFVDLTMLQQFFGVENIISVYWTLQIEIIFYIACAALFAFGRLRDPDTLLGVASMCLVLALIMAAMRYVHLGQPPVAIGLALFLMFSSTLWRLSIIDGDQRCGRYAGWLFAAFLLLIPLIARMAYAGGAPDRLSWSSYMVTYDAALIAFLVLTRVILIDHAVFSWLGRISYGTFEQPLIELSKRLGRTAGPINDLVMGR